MNRIVDNIILSRWYCKYGNLTDLGQLILIAAVNGVIALSREKNCLYIIIPTIFAINQSQLIVPYYHWFGNCDMIVSLPYICSATV